MLLILVALSIIPCLIWLAFFYFQDWYDREPLKNIAATFGLGALATAPAYLLNTNIGDIVKAVFAAFFGEGLGEVAMYFLIVGPVEEAVKFAAVYLYAYRRPEFNEPADGVVYSSASALGFAAIENILYLANSGLNVILLRAPLSNPGHAFFAAFWGLAMSRAKAAPNLPGRRRRILFLGWFLAALMHGLFNTILSAQPLVGSLAVAGLVLMLMGLMFAYIEFNIIQMVRRSPHRAGTRLLTTPVVCAQCGAAGFPGGQCFQCGSALAQVSNAKQGFSRQCRNCGKFCVPGARFCTYCGATFDVPRLAPQNAWQAQRNGANQQPHFARITQTGQEEVIFVINTTQVRVGKTLDNEFVLEHDSISKHHAAVIWHKSGYYYIADLKSTNGTYVNGKRVSEQWLLDGCEVRLGDVHLVYRGPRFQVYNPDHQ